MSMSQSVLLMIHSSNFSTLDSTSLAERLDPRSEPELSRTGHTVVAVFLGFILFFGITGNFLVLLVFAKFPALRTPINLILINISASDMLVCIFGTPFSFIASVYGRWMIGSQGCRWYGFANALFGIVSLVSLALLSYERYSTVLRSSQPDLSDYSKAWLAIGGSWLYSLAWTLPPLLGWSSYGPEGPGTTCSVQWAQRSARTQSYVGCLFVFCLLLPLMSMLYCYGRILLAVRGVTRQINRVNQSLAQQRERRVLLMVVVMVTGYLLCWLPYGVVALLASFGRPGLVPSTFSLVPSLLAKTSTVLNPIIYVLLNNQFSRCFVLMMRCSSDIPTGPSLQALPSSKGQWPLIQNLPMEEQDQPRSSSLPPALDLQTEPPVLVLVTHYRP